MTATRPDPHPAGDRFLLPVRGRDQRDTVAGRVSTGGRARSTSGRTASEGLAGEPVGPPA